MDFAATGKERRIFGVDFSGAKDAGRKIWVSEGIVHGDELHILNCYPIFGLVPDKSKQRRACLSALRVLILSNTNSVFGMDFPFSLPDKLMSEKDWYSFVSAFPDDFNSADDFRNKMQQMGGKAELKRLTDVEVKAPFSIYNLWVYKQTYFGIRDVLRPLVTQGKACALPMQTPESEKPWLMEVCPASTLKSEGLYIGYKGRTEKEKKKREHILDKLIDNGIVVPDSIKEQIIKNKDGDALDSFVAAYATYRSALKMNDIIGKLPGIYLREGYTFF
ncbi:DUF429 domain-containing protein [Methanolobus bombayensis]|uniref:DUF429 domain-containing protein n=1 Tax=Methanolobus bombayensis TaxID=38023 RepID=UPI001AE3EE89|nr:DUF429 domain-containing protein [Methanolobus bombayensis]MBP1907925.1 hypothetical protein [Methanolobus bombayensis]